MREDWRKIERGLFESPDGQWRIANPWKLTTELRHRWLVAQRRTSGSGWCMHDGDHATLHDARAYVERVADITPSGKLPAQSRRGKTFERDPFPLHGGDHYQEPCLWHVHCSGNGPGRREARCRGAEALDSVAVSYTRDLGYVSLTNA
jgi:hypothetical protein